MTPIAMHRRKILIPTFLVVVFLYWVALYLYVPTLPLYIRTKTTDLALVGTVLSMYGLWQIVSRLPVGISVDWVGRRKPFVIGLLLLLALGDWLLGVSPDISAAALGRALVGVSAACWVPLVVMFSGMFPPTSVVRATAFMTMTGFFARIVATAANGWLNGLGGFPLAFKLAALAAVIGAVVMFFVPDNPHPSRPPSLTSFWKLASRKDVLLPSLLQALNHTADFAATFTFIPILARQKGATDVAVSLLVSLNLGMALAGNLLSATLSHRFGHRRMSALSFILIAAGVAGAAVAPSLLVVFLAQFAIGFGLGIGYPLLMGLSILHVAGPERTTAMGLHQSVYSVGMFAGPWLGGILAASLGIPAMFALIAVVTLLVGVAGSLALHAQPPTVAVASPIEVEP